MSAGKHTLTASQQDDVVRARELLAAIDGGHDAITAHMLALYERTRAFVPDSSSEAADRRRQMIRENPYPEATGSAAATIRALIDVIDDLAGGAR